ncbi:uncharacterized protein GGS22DRAFT_184589 [Annulohypoxylon maeteangense]|uniref:uncharacterized protein n=1 Tax=Annulohypoxylon maeteangense TaxID=1927788 RepID=UPI0020083F46|nr:uncharacterized protein GGS22DRAFT_184589 [Annulohypoxylon maeteangense]KAI0889013.1 hypothetical protein GGS22DRAFT_184589 [Annulohypoxylon maeteangense]
MADEEWSDPEYDVPLQNKRPFGSGLKRKRVVFVPASSGNLKTTEENAPVNTSHSVSDLYLSIVLPKDREVSQSASTEDSDATTSQICEICQLPLDENPKSGEKIKAEPRPHEASIAHQVCMAHSHPPSALDRSRMGLSVLQSQGWDPDSRKGLGVEQQGMQYPIKVKPKNDTLGIGVQVPKNLPMKKEKPKTFDAKKIRKMALEDKKRHEKLRRQFYGNPDVERYLGTG